MTWDVGKAHIHTAVAVLEGFGSFVHKLDDRGSEAVRVLDRLEATLRSNELKIIRVRGDYLDMMEQQTLKSAAAAANVNCPRMLTAIGVGISMSPLDYYVSASTDEDTDHGAPVAFVLDHIGIGSVRMMSSGPVE